MSSTPSVPTTMGRYEVLAELARGGMAQLLLARARGIEGFQKVVALKRILPHVARDPLFIRMFLDEARLAATLDHPNVVQVHDIGREEGEYFFTMEYVHGETVLAILKEGAVEGDELPLPLAVFIASEVASGLHHAHERIGFEGKPLGLIHRDVSPSNVMVSYEGAVKVTDFGIAKAAESSGETTGGVRKGKVAYMSPEQCLGGDLDQRTDVWSLGLMLYEMTTGQRPFRGETEFTLMEQIARGTPEPPSEVRPGYPEDLEAVVMRALERDREARFGTAQEFRDALLALDLRASTADLGDHVRNLFGPRPLPWEGTGLSRPEGAAPLAGPTAAELAQTRAVQTRASRSALPWVVAGIAAAGIMGVVLWPGSHVGDPTEPDQEEARAQPKTPAQEPAPTADAVPVPETEPASGLAPEPEVAQPSEPSPPTKPSASKSKAKSKAKAKSNAKSKSKAKSKPERGGLFDDFVE